MFSATFKPVSHSLLCSLASAALFCYSSPASVADAEQGRQRLHSFLADLVTLQADFQQTLFDESGQVLEQSSGEMALWRPGRFLWKTKTPYLQIIVVDEGRLWIYDPDLEQVIVHDANEALGYTPAALLIEEADPEQFFRITGMEPGAGEVAVIQLVSRATQNSYAELLLALSRDSVAWMEFSDPLGQRIRIQFDAVRHPELPPELFQFTPPPGVEVIQNLEIEGDAQ